MLSRRRFLGQWSVASVFTVGRRLFGRTSLGLIGSKSNLPPSEFVEHQWQPYGRIALKVLGDSVTIQDGYLAHQDRQKDCEVSFQARMPAGSDEVQIWAGVRCRDRDSRYVFALRGGNNDHLYLARYAPDGGAKFLGIAPLEFHPEPGTWYTLRAVAAGDRLQVYLNEEAVPRINIRDDDASWNEGTVAPITRLLSVNSSEAEEEHFYWEPVHNFLKPSRNLLKATGPALAKSCRCVSPNRRHSKVSSPSISRGLNLATVSSPEPVMARIPFGGTAKRCPPWQRSWTSTAI